MPEQTITTNLDFVTNDQASAQLARIEGYLKGVQDNTKKVKTGVKEMSAEFTPLLRTGRELERAGAGIARLGDFFGNEQIKKVGDLTAGVGGLAMSLGEVQKVLNLIKAGGGIGTAIGLGAAIGGGIFAGASIYDAMIGKQQGTDTGTILKQSAADIGAKISTSLVPAEQRTEAYTRALNENAHSMGIITDAQYKALGATYDASLRGAQEMDNFAKSIDHTAVSAQQAAAGFNALSDVAKGLGLGGVATALQGQARRTQPGFIEGAKEFQNYQSKLSDLEKKAIDDRAQIVRDGQKEINDITKRYYQETARAAQELQKQQMKIVNDGIKQENQEEQTYYKDRAKQAAQFGEEMQRLEEDHQVAMQRMGQDHNIRLRKLADSRDALAIEDEQQQYELERGRAEQDYQKEVGRRNQDLARTLADQDASFKEQRAQRQQDRQQQLADLQANYNDQQAQRRQAFNDEIAQRRQDQAARLSEIDRNLGEERRATTEQWTQWRQEHGLFLQGEKALWDNYLEYTYQQLEKAMSGTAPGLGYGSDTTTTGMHAHQAGGYQTYTGATMMHAGEFVVNKNTTQALERLVGGQLSQASLLSSVGGAGNTVSINVSQSFSGQESNPAMYRQIVYQTMTEVFDKAMRQ